MNRHMARPLGYRNVLSWTTVVSALLGWFAACSRPVRDDGRGTRLVGQDPVEYELAVRKKEVRSKARHAQSDSLPSLNMTRGSGPPVPDVDTDEMARQVVDFLAGRSASPEVLFIPFAHYRRLHPNHSEAQLRRLHEKRYKKYMNKIKRLRNSGRYSGAIYLSFVLGRCRYLTEGKAGRYECTARLELEHDGERMHIPFRRVTNWGTRWYVLEP